MDRRVEVETRNYANPIACGARDFSPLIAASAATGLAGGFASNKAGGFACLGPATRAVAGGTGNQSEPTAIGAFLIYVKPRYLLGGQLCRHSRHGRGTHGIRAVQRGDGAGRTLSHKKGSERN